MLRALALALVVAGCQASPESTAPNVPGETTPPDPIAQTEAPEAGAALVLDIDGLRVVQGAATRPVPFGLKMEGAVSIVAARQGEPAERGTNEECGAGPLAFAAWSDGLTLYGDGGAFAGWAVGGQDGASPYATLSGLGPGSTRADLDGAYAATVEPTSLGTEFFIPAGEEGANLGMSGILSSEGADATVEAMWAGASCTFR